MNAESIFGLYFVLPCNLTMLCSPVTYRISGKTGQSDIGNSVIGKLGAFNINQAISTVISMELLAHQPATLSFGDKNSKPVSTQL